jgi:ATP-dependent DNA helicase RecG
MQSMSFDDPLTVLHGVGDNVAKKFEVLGIKTVGQLINYFPRRYEDYSEVLSTNQLKPGAVTIKASIKQVSGRYVRRGLHITEAIASDELGSVRLIWFNQPYRATYLKIGQPYYISGIYELARQRFAIMNPAAELVSSFPINTARIIPVYRETKGLTSRQIRSALQQALPLLESSKETLPKWLVKEQKLLSRAEAVKAIHFPESSEQLELARQRLGFEEVFELTLAGLLNKQANHSEKGVAIKFKIPLAKQFVAELPFDLTDDQRRVSWQIFQDLGKSEPMNRLLEGDVGSGKTVVAVMAALMAMENGWQVALMAPTELLARQHADTLARLLKPHGRDQAVGLLVGSLSTQQKANARKAIADGKAQLIVGTHALITDLVDMHRLALVVIDEQHRFGVDQRKALQAKAGHMPHVLSLTATPIPRTLALTLYGELDVSLLATKPGGRLPIITKIVSPNSRAQLYEEVDKEVEAGRQVYIVCPLITDSALKEGNSVEKVYAQLSKHEFKHRRVGLLHGKLKAAEKQKVMKGFVDKKLDILVATTVIEVGVDVENATVMVIENADQFGLAQLHQLRGRVGRGQVQGYCYLVLSDSSQPTRRLRALESSNDGFRLAELDLEIRGPGAIYGALQHGQLDLRIAKLSDSKLIASARVAAHQFIDRSENLLQYKELANKVIPLRAVTNLN